MPDHLRASPAFNRILEKGTMIERRIVGATAMMEVACLDRLYDSRESEKGDLRVLLHEAADRALEAWVAAFLVALEGFEQAHPDVHVKTIPTEPGRT